ncbi:hypothetical protein JCM11491_001531 [Sporobolomyces phaffii]
MDASKGTTFSSVRLSRRHRSSTDSTDVVSDPTSGSLHLSTHHIAFKPDRAPTADATTGTPSDARSTGRLADDDSGGETAVLVSSLARSLVPLGAVDCDSHVPPTSSDPSQIPLSLVHSVTRTPPTFTGAPNPLLIRTRDFFTYALEFTTVQHVDHAYETLKHLCATFSVGGLESRWAFATAATAADEKKRSTGWDLYNPEEEFARMGVGRRTKAWRFSDINSDFNFCPSYPARIIVPSRISDTTLSYAVKYRSKCRIPGLVYLHWANYGSITRSSQPMVGITQTSRSIQDEKLIEAIFTSHSQHSGSREAFTVSDSSSPSDSVGAGGIVYGAMATNVIIDARPTKNAYANSVKGAGTENMTFYKNCRKEYLGIDNIHVMRASLNGVFQVLADAETTGQVDRFALRRTNWLSHLTNILEGTLIVIRTIHLSNSHVLVHCSDGWDRTSQLSALPQICLDPFYRTARGFAVLIEKDWIAYGHKFADRSGHLCNDRVEFTTKPGGGGGGSGGAGGGGGEDEDHSSATQQSFLASVQKQFASSSHAFKETCPVFQQFLDCIYQVQRQFPDRFEWNEALLRKLVWETYSARSGSFLFNSELERSRNRARDKTDSVWDHVFDVEHDGDEDGGPKFVLQPRYRNPLYDPSLDDPQSKSPSADQGVLLFNPQDVKYWHELFGRSDRELNPVQPIPPAATATTEHETVTSASEDPGLGPLAAHTSSLSIRRSPAPADPRSASPRPRIDRDEASSPAGFAQPLAVAETVASVQKLGWSAWKTVQKFGQEAAKQYKERSATAASSADAGSHGEEAAGDSDAEWTSSPFVRSEGGGAKGLDERPSMTGGSGRQENANGGSGMWGHLPTLGGGNPWQQQSEPTPNGSKLASTSTSDPLSTTTVPYTPYQPRKSSSRSSHDPAVSAPVPVQRQASSALSINPWESISKEDALPLPPPREPSKASNGDAREREEARGSGDPLGVGGL